MTAVRSIVLSLAIACCAQTVSCNPKTSGLVGDACSDSSPCSIGVVCEGRFPEGYCTRVCTSSDDCRNGACVPIAGADSMCLATCEDDAGCRSGYTCRDAGGTRVCWPDGFALTTAGLNQECSESLCEKGLDCVQDPEKKKPPRCSQPCDPAKPCSGGGACYPITPDGDIAGACGDSPQVKGDTCVDDKGCPASYRCYLLTHVCVRVCDTATQCAQAGGQCYPVDTGKGACLQ